MASRSSRAMIPATATSPSYTKDLRNITRHNATRTTTSTATSGARWTRKSLKVRPARLAMMMLGGSPTRVAVPPMLEANTSAIEEGSGRQREPLADQQRHRGDQQDRGDVVEERGGDGRDDDEHGHHPEGLGLRLLHGPDGQVLDMPVFFSTPTIIIMPISRKMTFQSTPESSE